MQLPVSNRIETYLLYIYIYVGSLRQCVRSRLFMEFELLAGPNKRMPHWLTDRLPEWQTDSETEKSRQTDWLLGCLNKRLTHSLSRAAGSANGGRDKDADEAGGGIGNRCLWSRCDCDADANPSWMPTVYEYVVKCKNDFLSKQANKQSERRT